MRKAYIYPVSSRYRKVIHNPYIDDFINSLEDSFVFLNKTRPSNIGIFDLVKYVGKINYVFFHWPENIPERKNGIFQTFFLFFIIMIFRVFRTKIIYIVHNKVSHSKKYIREKTIITKLLIKNSFLMITHAKDGIDFINSFGINNKNIFYFPHPIHDERPFPKLKKDIDVLIWGNISPYKGIDEFLFLVRQNSFGYIPKIVIAGKVSSNEYLIQLERLSGENVMITDDFVEEQDLNLLICKSKIVLFPYLSESVLSSGAFSKTLSFPVKIMGPSCGAFKDFRSFPNVYIYTSHEEMIATMQKIFDDSLTIEDFKTDFINELSWNNFAKKLMKHIFK